MLFFARLYFALAAGASEAVVATYVDALGPWHGEFFSPATKERGGDHLGG